ncbi:hypothetical protein DE146DRAFT_440409 [Phaeosphaeria sp. MPI-PUGE-AT-0046c]|nr:hypothetical protein DE146DRAFT_440409 [Phaeosphaeria sp. MPI-PUGE-AT-0046c]
MATALAVADRRIVSLILKHLSNMKYKDRRQGGPDQPVEFLEFRPTLVPAILVNKLWGDEGTSILWNRYPYLHALASMPLERRQWYAAKIESVFVLSPPLESGESLTYLHNLKWPALKCLELDVAWQQDISNLQNMLHSGLESLDISGERLGGSTYIIESVLPTVFTHCRKLRAIHIGPDAIHSEDPVHNQDLTTLLEDHHDIKAIGIMKANIFGKDLLFGRLSQRPGLESLDIDLDPGLQLLPLLRDPAEPAPLFDSLTDLHIMCYPEIALSLCPHLSRLNRLSMDIARIPSHPVQDADFSTLTDIMRALVQCKQLQMLKVNIGQLAVDFPSAASLPALQGEALVQLAMSCPKLTDLTLLSSEPAAIDASDISSAHFERFCRQVPDLAHLSLKFHPRTTLALEESALQSLGRHCRQLETLRLKIALQLPSLVALNETPCMHTVNTKHDQDHTDGISAAEYVEIKAFDTDAPMPAPPLFSRLTHLAMARPQTILSVAASTYSASTISQGNSSVDPWIEAELVQCWAQSFIRHFPYLEVLEAWSDWTGHDNDSLNYFLPLQEPLASTWEFLSGIEQDLWNDGQEHDTDGPERWDDDFEEDISFDSRGSGDWDRASLVNEFPEVQEFDDSGYLEPYEEEPADMITPIDDREEWFSNSDTKPTTNSADFSHIMKPEHGSVHELSKHMDQVTINTGDGQPKF